MSRLKNILLIGGGGHCVSVIDTIIKSKEFDKVAIIDKEMATGKMLMNIPCIGNDDMLDSLFNNEYTNAFVSMGSVGNAHNRIKLFNKLIKIGYNLPNIIDLSSIIGEEVKLGLGIYIGKNAIINGSSQVGNGAIINTSSIIEHNCLIEEFTHIAPGAVLCGNVSVGKQSHIGANATIKQNIVIGDNVMIGMGSVVLKDIPDNKTAYGNPAIEVDYE